MSVEKSPNVVWHASSVTNAQRSAALGQRGAILWFTGLSGSGKSTVAHAVDAALVARGHASYVLDGDNLRHGLNRDLAFGPEDRAENIRRIGEVARLFADASVLSLCAFVSPYRADRDRIRDLVPAGAFIEIHVATSLEECERRDPKGLYKRARAGEIADMTGISAPYEAPLQPEIVVDTAGATLQACVATVVEYLEAGGYLAATEGTGDGEPSKDTA